MADFNLTQTDAQVQSILNDAQDAQGAGAQTTLTTDYIMLKGTNGRYHKILKDSFTEAVRNVLAGLLVNNDKGTTISQIAAIASGDFGSVTPTNLASVLGGLQFIKTLKETDDLNDYKSTCVLENNGLNHIPQNAPLSSGWAGIYLVIRSATYTVQMALKRESNAVYYRIYNNSSDTWFDWCRIDNFGCNTLAELKAALAAV